MCRLWKYFNKKKGRSKIYYYCSSYVRNKTCTSHGIKEEYELIDNVYIEENGGIKIKFRYQDEFIQAIDFIKINNCAII